ncbi:MAG TPA: DUF790 family protein [Roseiflexaceae bacterium]|nr:DUF790 family protein [Roseiflexaceae bacterium]
MAFKTADFKKTTRRSGEERLLYPYQIRDDRYTAAIGYAITYYERMVGRRQAEFETEALLEFFGDPKLARGLVACLARTYLWREQTFADAFGEPTARALWRAGLASPADLRARLYGLANGRYGGVILPHERAAALEFLCARLSADPTALPTEQAPEGAPLLTPDQFERALTLDAEDQRILVKVGPMPTPEEIVARYNYHSLETAICHAEHLRLRLRGPIWSIIRSAHNLARRYRLRYAVSGKSRTLFDDHVDLVLHGGRDALGSWTRAGRRLARALLRLLATHPDSLSSGEALVHLGGQSLLLRLDERALAVLGVAAREQPPESEAWEEDMAADFQRAWGRAYVAGKTAGWRLRRDPEPIVGAGAMVVPDFTLLRGGERLSLCLAGGRAAAQELVRDLALLGSRTPALAVVPGDVAEALPSCPVPLASYQEQPAEVIGALVTILERRYPRSAVPAETPWQRLERMVADDGFVGVEAVAALLATPAEEAMQAVRRWGGSGLHVLPGLGVCSPEALADIRQILERTGEAQAA